ncbi:MAG: pirin family protein [Pseudomonadota bacterium]
MITPRPAAARGRTHIDWLDSRHSFSFAEYWDPDHMGFRALRVINDDRVAAGAGFPTHGHRDMEIITYVLDGAIEHKDSLGNGSVIRPGEVQVMSAGTGIRHSEFNPSRTEPMRLLQIWIVPERDGLLPRYDQKAFPLGERRGRLRLVCSRDGREGSVTIFQDTDLYAAVLAPGERVSHPPRPGRHAWLQVALGEVALNGLALGPGDGAGASGEPRLDIVGATAAEILLFDLA